MNIQQIFSTLNKFKRPSVATQLEAVNKELAGLTKQKISSLNPQTYLKVFKNSDAKLANNIRKARDARSAGAKAELAFMQAHPELGRVLKSGNREFSSTEAKAGLDAARLQAYKDLGYGLNRKEKLIRAIKNNPKKSTALGLAAAAGVLGYNYEPINFYARDITKGALASMGLQTPSSKRDEDDMTGQFNKQAQELAALGIALNKHGLTDPEVGAYAYQVYNKSHGRPATYADFSNILNFFNPGQRVEYSDGGMSLEYSKDGDTYNAKLSDAAAWDPDKGTHYAWWSPRGIPVTLGVTKRKMGNKIDTMEYNYKIPAEKVDSMYQVYNKYKDAVARETALRKKKKKK